jgi:hypothetical protein
MRGRLRVGDIEIDGSRVTVGGTSLGPHGTTSPAPALAREPPEGGHLLHFAGARSGVLMASGGALSVGGAVLAIMTGLPSDILTFLFGGGVFVTAGLGLVSLGFVGRRLAARANEHEGLLRRQAAQPTIVRLRPLMTTTKGLTLEKLVDLAALPEEEIVRALVIMRDEGVVLEELDTATGHWIYVLEAPSNKSSRDLDTRLRDLERRGR